MLKQNYMAFPLMWVDQNSVIDAPNADKWKSKVSKPIKLANGMSYTLGIALGAILIILSWIVVIFVIKEER